MAQKVLYFLAGNSATSPELAEIARLAPKYEVLVFNGNANAEYGADRLAPCDLVAGTVPTAYNAKTVLDPAAVVQSPLLTTQAIVANAQELVVPVTGTYVTKATLTVVGGVVTAIVLS